MPSYRIYFSPFRNKWKNFSGNKEHIVFLNIKNPYYGDIEENNLKSFDNNDGGIIKDTRDPLLTDIYYFFNSNQIKSATNNTGSFSTKDDNIYNSDTIEEYETVASIGDYIQSYSPEDRAEIAREINNGNISIKCK